MSLPVVYRRKVGRDLAAGFEYYEGQIEELGEKFLTAVDSTSPALRAVKQAACGASWWMRMAYNRITRSFRGQARDEELSRPSAAACLEARH